MNAGRIECNAQQCPHKYHYSTTNMKLVHGQLGIDRNNTAQNNDEIYNVNNSFSHKNSYEIDSPGVYRLRNTVKSIGNLFDNNPTESQYVKSYWSVPNQDYSISEGKKEIGKMEDLDNIMNKDNIMDTFSNIGGINTSDEEDNIYQHYQVVEDFENNVEGFTSTDYIHDYYSEENLYKNEDKQSQHGQYSDNHTVEKNGYYSHDYYGGHGNSSQDLQVESFLMENSKGDISQVSVLTSNSKKYKSSYDPDCPEDGSETTTYTSNTVGIVIKTQDGTTMCAPLDTNNKEESFKKISKFMYQYQNGQAISSDDDTAKSTHVVNNGDSDFVKSMRKERIQQQEYEKSKDVQQPQGLVSRIRNIFR